MGLVNKILGGKLKTEELEGQISGLQGTVGQLEAEHAAAEQAATEAATDPDKYEDAAAAAKVRAVALDQARERLARLKALHAAEAGKEQAAYIKALEAQLEEAKENCQRAAIQARADREAEVKRHAEMMATLEARETQARNAIRNAERDLQRAMAGLDPRTARQIAELQEEMTRVRAGYNADLDRQVIEANGVAADALHRVHEAEGLVYQGGRSGSLLDDARREYEAAKFEADRLNGIKSEREAAIRRLIVQKDELLAHIPPQAR